MRAQRQLLTFVLSGIVVATSLNSYAQEAEKKKKKKPPQVTYDDHVQPILRQKCFSCHNADKKEGDLDLSNYTNLMIGGGSGEVVEPGDSSGSYLYQLITHDSEPYMPPEQPKIADEMVEGMIAFLFVFSIFCITLRAMHQSMMIGKRQGL